MQACLIPEAVSLSTYHAAFMQIHIVPWKKHQLLGLKETWNLPRSGASIYELEKLSQKLKCLYQLQSYLIDISWPLI